MNLESQKKITYPIPDCIFNCLSFVKKFAICIYPKGKHTAKRNASLVLKRPILRQSLNIGLYFIFALILFCQYLLWTNIKTIKPDMIIVPNVPDERTVNILALGDKQFYFRQLAFTIQNAGDSWGRFTALKDYDYPKLLEWFLLLDSLDSKSNFVPSLASYYYAQTQTKSDTIYVIEYLRQHAARDLRTKWWWMTQAVYIANHILKDKELALELAYELSKTPMDVKMPMWARQMPAFIHEQLGERDESKAIIVNILENFDNLTEGELNFMEYFIRDRLEDEEFRFEIIEELRKRSNTKSHSQK